MFFTVTETLQNWPWAFLFRNSEPTWAMPHSTLVTVNSNLPSRAGWLSPTVGAFVLAPPPPGLLAASVTALPTRAVQATTPPHSTSRTATMMLMIRRALLFFFGGG